MLTCLLRESAPFPIPLPALDNAQLETLAYEGRPFIETEVIVSSGYREIWYRVAVNHAVTTSLANQSFRHLTQSSLTGNLYFAPCPLRKFPREFH